MLLFTLPLSAGPTSEALFLSFKRVHLPMENYSVHWTWPPVSISARSCLSQTFWIYCGTVLNWISFWTVFGGRIWKMQTWKTGYPCWVLQLLYSCVHAHRDHTTARATPDMLQKHYVKSHQNIFKRLVYFCYDYFFWRRRRRRMFALLSHLV